MIQIGMLKHRLVGLLPDPERVRKNRLLGFLGPALARPQLWRPTRRGVALGLAIGVFFGLLIPFAQIPFSAFFAVLLRANLPIAIASTLVTNPVTFAPLYFLAYKLGHAVMNAAVEVESEVEAAISETGSWLSTSLGFMGEHGLPLAIGLLLMATLLSMTAYIAVHGIWRTLIVRAWRRRAARRAGRS